MPAGIRSPQPARNDSAIEVCMGVGIPMGMGFPRESHGNGNSRTDHDGNRNGNGSKSSGNGNGIYFMSVKIPRMFVKQDISDVEIKSAIECCRCG